MASPPKPWEQPGAATTAAAPSMSSSVAPGTTAASPTDSSAAPPLPNRPSSLTSAVNQNAANYSRMNSSPYGSMGGAYSSPYSRMGMGGGMGGYGGGYGSMYGGGGYGGYGGGMYGGMGGGMYGGGMGMPGDQNSLTNSFNNSTQATFQMLEGIVTAFGGFAQMLESTYMATHSSFFAMVSVAEQFGNLRDTLGSVLGIFTMMRWIRTLLAKITGRPPPADATALTPAAFARFEGRSIGPDGNPAPTKASRKPLIFFVLAAFGIPYLMSKMIRSLAASQEQEQKRLQAQALEAQQPVDPSKLEFCRLTFDFLPQPNTGMELEARKGDLVAVLNKNDPSGNPSEWWQCRARDGRQGYLPSTYLEVIKRPAQEPKKLKAALSESSRTNSLTSSIAHPEGGNKEYASADGMQRSHFYS
ncbi:hypothetical protein ACHAP5_007148 [Fusarium lateritium]